MQQAQADRLDHWNFYQARNVRQEVAAAAAVQLKLASAGAPAGQQEAYRAAIASYDALAAEQAKKKDELQQQANQDQKNYDALNYRDDQFDLSDALIALAISLLALTALTHKNWLYGWRSSRRSEALSWDWRDSSGGTCIPTRSRACCPDARESPAKAGHYRPRRPF
jgi:hypothetical protein